MPSITSSSNGGTKVKILATERAKINEVHRLFAWLAANARGDLAKASMDVERILGLAMTLLPTEEKTGATPKPQAKGA